MASIADISRLQQRATEIERLRKRVAALEAEVQEMRRLNRRVAELTDVVEELLLPAADRDDERLQQALGKYAQTL